jgi:type I restriction enzyme S subunit
MKMKYSGIDWIGMVPEAWEVRPLKTCFSLSFSGVWGQEYESGLESAICYRVADFDDSKGVVSDAKLTIRGYLENELRGKLINQGDLLLEKSGGGEQSPVGRMVRVTSCGKATCSNFVQQFRCNKSSFSSYVYYVFKCLYSRKINGYFYNQTIGIQNLKVAQYISIGFPFPPLPEQQAIANYLDEKCGKIEEQVKLLEKKVEAYNNLKRSIINETVTRGLDKNVKLKDSGVDWIGMVPEGWEVTRIGSLYDNRSSKVSDRDYPPLLVSKKGIVPQMESVAKTDNNDDRKMVCVGDFVINSRSDRRGACGISSYNGSVSVINIVLKPQRNMCSKYYNWLFRTTFFADEFYNHGHGIVDDLWSTKWSDMKDIEVISPPLSEQQAIANYLDEKCDKIDKAIDLVKKQIDAYKRLKRSLINEVVTGKRRVA